MLFFVQLMRNNAEIPGHWPTFGGAISVRTF